MIQKKTGFQPTIPKGSHFTLENIPFGVISSQNNPSRRCATAVGEHALDLDALSLLKFFDDDAVNRAFTKPSLNEFATLPAPTRTKARTQIIEGLESGGIPESCTVLLKDVEMHLPMETREYTDFCASVEHLTNCSAMTGGTISENSLIMPIAYNGRASSILPSPQQVRRPKGIYWDSQDPKTRKAVFGTCQKLDYELEMGFFISKPVPYGVSLSSPAEAREHIFGMVLLNDWSARDIQQFEMTPLGPLHSKAFATTISPWIVTLDALEQFSCAPKYKQEPHFEYLRYPDSSSGSRVTFDNAAFAVNLSASVVRGGKEYELCTSNLHYLYWTPDQQLSHHTSSACGIQTGDLMGTGTISGDAIDEVTGKKKELACLFESSVGGKQPMKLKNKEGHEIELAYLEDGDEVVIRGWCGAEGDGVSLGFGESRGVILSNSKRQPSRCES